MLLTTLLLLGQIAPSIPDPDEASTYSNREMNSYTSKPPIVASSCVRKFMRMKVPQVSMDIILDLDQDGNVSSANLGSASQDEGLNLCVLNWVRTLTFKDESPRRGIYVAGFINARLTPPLPKYAQYESDDAAIIHNWGSAFTLCGLTGLAGPNRKKACSAYAALIDGRLAKWYGGMNRIAPGRHQINLACSIQAFHGTAFPIPTMQAQTHSFVLEAGESYKLEPRWEDDLCVVDIININNRLKLEKKP